MLSIHYRPLYDFQNELGQLQYQMDGLFSRGRGTQRRGMGTSFPLLNAWDSDECFYVEAELPGLEMDDLEIFMADRTTLTIKGNRKQPSLEGGQWHRRERAFGAFERSLALPDAVSQDDVEAWMKNGVLTIKLPKAPELRPRKIQVKAS